MRKKKRLQSSSIKIKIFVLTLLIIVAGAAAISTFSKGGQPFANENQKNEFNNDISSKDSASDSGTFASENDNQDAEQKAASENLNFLLVGVDNEESGSARTDTIMLANVNPKEGDVKLASIMRDSYVEIPGHQNNKINASFAYGGVDLLRETIEENFDIDIDYHATVNFDGFVDVVDTVAPEGLEVDIEKRMYYQDNSGEVSIDFQPGTQYLDGDKTLEYVRYRSDSNNDFGRVARQQEILGILKDELLSFASVTKVPQIIGAIRPNLETDVSTSKMLSLGKDVLLNPVEDINTLRIPVEETYTNQSYSHAGSVLELDMEENSEELHNFFDGKTSESVQTASGESEKEDDEEEY
ncbi:LCP family protein [Alteribacillus sp. YIM 98480]|uniref:LCP family protein n=1 Tax=Alteribacillus sp. YIM 98480 TaxID=2606599 RepID=UPI00131E4392|nr:LCP family protein [Alteribacillus sp. YIM 98480]